MTIAQCAYCIRKGEEPRADRGNIFPWDMVKERDDEFEPFLRPLPKLASVPAEPAPAPAAAPPSSDQAPGVDDEAQRAQRERVAKIKLTFDHLQPEDFGAKTKLPLVAPVRTLSGVEDASLEEIEGLWKQHKKEKE